LLWLGMQRRRREEQTGYARNKQSLEHGRKTSQGFLDAG